MPLQRRRRTVLAYTPEQDPDAGNSHVVVFPPREQQQEHHVGLSVEPLLPRDTTKSVVRISAGRCN